MRWIGGVLVVVIAIVTVLVIEGGASFALLTLDYMTAAAPDTAIRPHTEYDTLVGWINRPSFSSPNEYGRGIGLTTTPERFRGTAPLGPLAPGHTRLVCSGDSFTLGVGVSNDRHWCGLLEGLLPGLETVNMGQGAYGVDQAYLRYRRDGVRVPHQFQLVALTYVQFDRALAGTYSGRFRPFFEVSGDSLVTKNVPVPRQTTAALRRAYAVRLLEDLRVMQAIRRIPRFDGRQRAAQQVDARWPIFERMFDDMVALHRANGTRLVIAYLPTRREATPGPLDTRRRRLAEFAKRRGVLFFDLTPALRALPADSVDNAFISWVERGVAPEVIGHYSVVGNAWAARELARDLAGVTGLRLKTTRTTVR